MSINTINISDFTNQDAMLRVILEMQNHGTSYSLIQNGVEVAKVVPVEKEQNTVSDDLTKQRLAVFAEVEILSKRIAQSWSTDETAVEAITNDRNASDRRLFHGSH